MFNLNFPWKSPSISISTDLIAGRYVTKFLGFGFKGSFKKMEQVDYQS